MSSALLRRIASLSFTSSHPTSTQSTAIKAPLLSLSSSPSSRLFSSQSPSLPHDQSSSDESRLPTSSNDDLPADVTTEELKQRIGRYLEGDMEALPSVFEAILARKLSGNHEDTDDELMDELQLKRPLDNHDDELFESDDDDLSESDSD